MHSNKHEEIQLSITRNLIRVMKVSWHARDLRKSAKVWLEKIHQLISVYVQLYTSWVYWNISIWINVWKKFTYWHYVWNARELTSNKNTRYYIDDLKERIERTRQIVEQHTDRTKHKQKQKYDKKIRGVNIEIGDKVLVKILAHSEGKKQTSR